MEGWNHILNCTSAPNLLYCNSINGKLIGLSSCHSFPDPLFVLRTMMEQDQTTTVSFSTPDTSARRGVISALLVVVVIQQVQIGRMRQSIDAQIEKKKEKLTQIVRELRDVLERHR